MLWLSTKYHSPFAATLLEYSCYSLTLTWCRFSVSILLQKLKKKKKNLIIGGELISLISMGYELTYEVGIILTIMCQKLDYDS